MKLKYLLMGALVSVAFTACTNDDEPILMTILFLSLMYERSDIFCSSCVFCFKILRYMSMPQSDIRPGFI